MLVLILGIVVFLGVHSVRIFAPDWRTARIASGGEGSWKGFYSLFSLLGLVLIVWGYARAWPTAPILYEPPQWLKHISLTLMLLAFISLSAYGFPAGRIKAWLKHPMLVAVKIWALAHLLANGDLAALILFGSFLVWAVLDRISVKRRGDNGSPPGPVKWDIAAVIVGVAFYLLFIWKAHLWLFGVMPLP